MLEDALSERFENSLDMRSVGGEGYGLTKEIHAKLQELLERPAITRPPPLQTEAATLQEIVDEICKEADYDIEEKEDVVLTFQGGSAVQEQVRDALVRAKTKEQLGKRCLKVGFHHGHFNPLPSSFRYPKKMNIIQMITLYQMGSPSDGVPPLKMLSCVHVRHFDIDGNGLSRMSCIMKVVKHFAVQGGVWKPRGAINYWDGESVTKLWTAIWEDVKQYLLTPTQMRGGGVSYHKSRSGSLSWRTCHDKFTKLGCYKLLKV
jgi:hypothetical protein